MNIGKVELDMSFYDPKRDTYSDGDIEAEILEIVKEGREKEVLYADNRWPILYYFSRIRHNIVSWYGFQKGKTVLEIGTGCGAITGLFTQKGLKVDGVESSKRRATITAYRNKNYSDLRIFVGDFNIMEFPQKYDYITLIGVLEYARMFLPESRDPYADMLAKCKKLLKDGGKLFIAIENRLGLKYFAGAHEDHTGRVFDGIEGYPTSRKIQTFSKSELSGLLTKAGLHDAEWYYPYPDYKLPVVVYSDEFLPDGEKVAQEITAYDSSREMYFDERKAIQKIADAKDFATFSNSFLVICH